MIPLCNGFYLFPLSRAVNSNSLIFDPSEFKIGLYELVFSLNINSRWKYLNCYIIWNLCNCKQVRIFIISCDFNS